ncbi:MAG: NAD-dependent epimerase/dehydratase family protein [Methylomarinum sp.]|nr:NAD-dependent epimerase/dehydratase family protein [Methylomarinum sp.]
MLVEKKPFKSPQTVLIIGSQGFIGKNIVEQLVSSNINLVLFVRDSTKLDPAVINANLVTVVEGDLSTFSLLKDTLVKYQVDTVLHLVSALIPSSNFNEFNKEIDEVVKPTYELLNYLSELKIRIIYFSSGGTIYGKTIGNRITEEHQTNPINYYGYSKLLIENYIQYLHRTNDLSFLILRPSNVYGRYQRLDKLQGFIAVAIGKILSNDVINVFGNGESVRDYIDVEDLAFLTDKLIHSGIANQVFNIGTGIGVSLNDILLVLQEITHCELNINYTDERAVDVSRIILDVEKLKKAIEFKPKKLSDGIENFIKYVKHNNAKQ